MNWPPTPHEQQYSLWRLRGQKVPGKGHISFLNQIWYTQVLKNRVFGRVPEWQIPTAMVPINAVEGQMVDDETAIAFFRLDLSRKDLKHQLKKYADDPLQSWRVPQNTGSKKNVRIDRHPYAGIGSVGGLLRGRSWQTCQIYTELATKTVRFSHICCFSL